MFRVSGGLVVLLLTLESLSSLFTTPIAVIARVKAGVTVIVRVAAAGEAIAPMLQISAAVVVPMNVPLFVQLGEIAFTKIGCAKFTYKFALFTAAPLLLTAKLNVSGWPTA